MTRKKEKIKFPPMKGIVAAPLNAHLEMFDIILGVRGEPIERVGPYAIVDVCGPLFQHGMAPFSSYEEIREHVGLACEMNDVETIVLRIDSPGGDFAGSLELASDLRSRVRYAKKRLLAYTDSMALSAAYALACAADEICITPSAFVGSIGVWQALTDQTKLDHAMGLDVRILASGIHKADRNPHVPISDSAVVRLQDEVDSMAELFFDAVSDLRNIPRSRIQSLEGSQQFGATAVALGLADRIVVSFDHVLKGEGDMPKFFEEARGAYRKSLAKLAAEDSDDGKEARSALAEMDKDEEKKAKKAKAAEDKEDAEAKAEGDEPKKEESESKAAASAASEPSPLSADPSLALAAQHQATVAELNTMKAKEAARALAEEKAKLLASRPDFDNATRAVLASSPLETIRAAVRDFPKPTIVTNDPVSSAAAMTPGATRGKSDKADGIHAPTGQFVGEETLEAFMNRKMGLSKVETGIKREGRTLALGFLSPAAAKAKMAELEAKLASDQEEVK